MIADGGTCTDGDTCSTNPNPCRVGYALCATQSCIDSAAVIRSPGQPCGANRFCTSSGQCELCLPGERCTGNPNPCRSGVTSCMTGSPTCLDGAEFDAGTRCGAAGLCMNGACSECPTNTMCFNNPSPCRFGRCQGTTGVCVDATFKPTLTACDGGGCNSAGTCVQCDIGGPCSANPGAPCQRGEQFFDGVACRCVNAAPAANGGSCDGGLCTGGVCQACAIGAACGTSCSPGVLAASDAGCLCAPSTPPGNGASCPGGICSDGACCTGCTTYDRSACLPGASTANCGSGGAVCASCVAPVTYGPCKYASTCAMTGSRDVYESFCNSAATCQTGITGSIPNDPFCNRLTQGTVCGNDCAVCGAVCGPAGLCDVQCGGGC